LTDLQEVGVTAKSLRPSIASSRYAHGIPVSQIKEDLNHRHISTTSRYIERLTFHDAVLIKARQFQVHLVNESTESSSKATGTGFLCGAEEVSKKKPCGNVLACFPCDARRVVITSKSLASEWIAWRDHILAHSSRLKFENYQRWAQYWEPRLEEYRFLISRTNPALLKQAGRIAEKIKMPHIS